MTKFMIPVTAALAVFVLSTSAAQASWLKEDAPKDPRTSSGAPSTKVETEEKKPESTIGSIVSLGSSALKEVGGTEGVKSFADDYMKLATEVEQKVTDAQNERIKSGRTANKFTEIYERTKQSPTMIAFVAKRALLPIGKALFGWFK